MSKPAWTNSIEARKAAAEAAVSLQGQGQTLPDIARAMEIQPADLESWITEHYRPERIRGEYIAPEHNTVEGHEKRLDLAAQQAEERHGLGWFKSELRSCLSESDRAFMERMDSRQFATLTVTERARLDGLQKTMLVSHEFVIRLFDFITHGFQITKYRIREAVVRKGYGYTAHIMQIASVLPTGPCRWPASKMRRNTMVVFKDERGTVSRVFLRASIRKETERLWTVMYEDPFTALDKESTGDRFLHLYHLAKMDRDSVLTQAQLGKMGGKTKAASSAMQRGMDKELRRRSQSRTGFLVKPPKEA